jgi:hypothetical protein
VVRAAGRRLFLLLLLLALAAAVGPTPCAAQIYHWVDDQGADHYGMGLESVPQPYRGRARLLPDDAAPGARGTQSGALTIPFRPGAPIVVEVRLNGAGPARLILDTGAERTMVAPATMARLGIVAPRIGRGQLQGVGGTVPVEVVRINSIELGGVTVGPVSVALHDAQLRVAEGLLGQDVLSAFAVSIDAAAGFVTLTPRGPAPR